MRDRATDEPILRPAATGWELWTFPKKGPAQCKPVSGASDIPGATRPLLGLPTRDALAIPLWISSKADPAEIVELELSSRHLLRRDAAVSAIPLQTEGDRTLVLAVAAADRGTSEPYFGTAGRFDLAARLWDPGRADVLLWHELGELCYGIWRGTDCVLSAASGEQSPGPAFCGFLRRTITRLKAEGVITSAPTSATAIGEFSAEDLSALATGLQLQVTSSPAPPPRHPVPRVDTAPPAARAQAIKRSGQKRFANIAFAVGLVYLALVTAIATDYVLLRLRVSRLKSTAASFEPRAEAARSALVQWQTFRTAIDPDTYALDQLAAVARALPGDQVRLTQYALDNGRLLISGEAGDVTQAYAFFEKVKASPILQEYDWTQRQPQLAGKTKVRFEVEGVRPDAKTEGQ